MYKVVVRFADIQDGYKVYNPGDTYPREGLKVTTGRIAELASPNNRRGVPLIVMVKDYTPEELSITPKKAAKPVKGTNTPKATKKTVNEDDKPKRGRKKKDA